MDIATSLENGVNVVKLSGRFDAQSAGQVDEGLQKAVADGGNQLVIDMSHVEYISSARAPLNSPSEELNGAIVAAEATSVTLWTDTDRDEDHELELVRFRVDTTLGVLYRDSSSESFTFPGSSVRLVSTNVANDATTTPLFSYADAGGAILSTPVSAPGDIREVRIHLRVDVVQWASPTTHVLTSIVQPRNLRQY